MSNYLINTYECFSKPTISNTVSITDWLKQIKESSLSNKIIEIRSGKGDYEKTKASLPCVTYNFLFTNSKKNSNISSPTGLLYIDIDNPEFNINMLDLNKVYAYYHSFGGIGYAILVRVDGLSLNNFKDTYSHILNELGISAYIDVNAIKATQYSVLSFDPDLFLNESAYVFKAHSATLPEVKKSEKITYSTKGGATFANISLRYDNLDEIEFEGAYHVNWDGYAYIKCFILPNKIDDGRKRTLLSYCTNLVYLNPTIEPERTIKILMTVNNIKCSPALDEKIILGIVNSVHQYNKEKTLKPIYFNKKRKILFKLGYSAEEKLSICRTENIKRLKNNSIAKLKNIIENWDSTNYGQITQRKVYRNFPISKKTVEKYWGNLRELGFLNK